MIVLGLLHRIHGVALLSLARAPATMIVDQGCKSRLLKVNCPVWYVMLFEEGKLKIFIISATSSIHVFLRVTAPMSQETYTLCHDNKCNIFPFYKIVVTSQLYAILSQKLYSF